MFWIQQVFPYKRNNASSWVPPGCLTSLWIMNRGGIIRTQSFSNQGAAGAAALLRVEDLLHSLCAVIWLHCTSWYLDEKDLGWHFLNRPLLKAADVKVLFHNWPQSLQCAHACVCKGHSGGIKPPWLMSVKSYFQCGFFLGGIAACSRRRGNTNVVFLSVCLCHLPSVLFFALSLNFCHSAFIANSSLSWLLLSDCSFSYSVFLQSPTCSRQEDSPVECWLCPEHIHHTRN